MAEVVSLADRLRERRTELGISQSQAARELDVARTAYRLWEMDSARPAPDRWRLIARWLGISMSTLLMAEELMSLDEADTTAAAVAELGKVSARARATAFRDTRDFFDEARGLLRSAVGAGEISNDAAERMSDVLERIQDERAAPPTASWEPTEVLRELPADDRTADTARAGLRFVGAGVPALVLDEAERLIGELVERSVRIAGPDAGPIGVSIVVGRDRLRAEVFDPSVPPAAAAAEAGAEELHLVSRIADRWGGGTERGRRFTWFEIDLSAPGDVVADQVTDRA